MKDEPQEDKTVMTTSCGKSINYVRNILLGRVEKINSVNFCDSSEIRTTSG